MAPEFKWGELYQIITDQEIFDAGLEKIVLQQNIRRYGITKASMHPYIFSFSQVIGWILPKTDSSSGIYSNVKEEAFSSFNPYHIAAAYKLHPGQVMMTEDWIKGINIDPLQYINKMVEPDKQL